MGNHATIDFETRSELDVRKVGAYKYAEHHSTRLLSLAYNLSGKIDLEWRDKLSYFTGDQPVENAIEDFNEQSETKLWIPGMDDPEDLFQFIEDGGLVEAHNKMFEQCVWDMVCEEEYFWPGMPVEQWRCSMAKARYNSIPGSLDGAGKAMKISVAKDKRGKYLISKLCGPRKPTKNDPRIWIDDEDLLIEMFDYNVTDVDSEMDLSKALPPMTDKEVAIWQLDQKMNMRGVYIDIDTVYKVLEVLEQTTAFYQAKLSEISHGFFSSGNQREKILEWCDFEDFPLPDLKKETVEKFLKKDNMPDSVRQVMEIRQILGKTSTAKYKKIVEMLADDGRVHEVLVYHKAHTGRWGGAGVQLQNLARPTIDAEAEYLVELLQTGSMQEIQKVYENVFEVAASAIRSMIIPEEGNKFISADYAAIEARGLLWLVEDERGLNIFREGRCIYSDMAAEIYNTTYLDIYEKYLQEDFEASKKRKMGKDSVLGLGYQMGWKRFVSMCASSGTIITAEFAKKVVATYRKKYKIVKDFWKIVEKAARQAIQNPGQVFKANRLQFKMQGKFLLMRLPSGRCLHYPEACLKMKKTSWGEDKLTIHYKAFKDGQWREETTYGGKLTENAVQALSRDIMAEALLRLEEAKYYPIMSVHDEAVSEVAEDFGTLEEYCDIMCELPDWAEGFPLKASGWVGYRYRK